MSEMDETTIHIDKLLDELHGEWGRLTYHIYQVKKEIDKIEKKIDRLEGLKEEKNE